MADTKIYMVRNIISSLLDRDKRIIIIRKMILRFLDRKGSITKKQNLRWLQDNAIDDKSFCTQLDPDLWERTIQETKIVKDESKKIIKDIKYELGGGGVIDLLYFITLYIKPKIIVETGVAAGFSSSTFLHALNKLDSGHLYSSDFPYFRLENPEQYIGIVVSNDIKNRWSLFIDGDEKNLKKIYDEVDSINLFHYDSDKSYKGRQRAFKTLKNKLNPKAWLIFDDIQDNSHFYDLANTTQQYSWKIIYHENKWVGILIPKKYS
tara:strand:+ start:10632 stop:11423 length:792 start_codon:yes stop_codon:yes gene_type:complete